MLGLKNSVWLAAIWWLAATVAGQAQAADEQQPGTKLVLPGVRGGLPPLSGTSGKQATEGQPKPAAPNFQKSADEKLAEQEAAEEARRFVVPEGGPKEMVAYITKLISAPPPHDVATLKKLRKAILEAAEKILAAKPSQEQREFAVQAKMNMLDKPEQLTAFIDELQKGGHEKLARQVRGFMAQIELRKAMMAGRGEVKKPIDGAVKFLEEAPPEPNDLPLAYTTGMMAEMTGDKELATQTYTRLAKVFAASKNAKLAEFANMLEGVVRRLNLVGQEIKIEGKVLGGGAFDWSKYQGRVVLVDFWATWCMPCLRELPDVRGCYELYHHKGFDIVAISLDRNPADVENFVKERAIPWTIVIGDGKPCPSVSYYGIMSIPATMLVGKDGKVVVVNITGAALRGQLEKLLGPAEEKKIEKTTAEAESGK